LSACIAGSCPGTIKRGKFSAGANVCAFVKTLSFAKSAPLEAKIKKAKIETTAVNFMGYEPN
jgi:hypothetical protein